MKSIVSLSLSICLGASALPVVAQDRMEATHSAIARAISSEAARLARAGEPVGVVGQGATPGDSNWARVGKLAPGTEVIMTIKGSQPAKRYVVRADDSELTVTASKLGQNVRIARNDVAQIKTVTTRGWPGALLGGAGGVALGVILVNTMECDAADFGKCLVRDLFLVPVGAAIAGYFAFRDKTEHVIYSAP